MPNVGPGAKRVGFDFPLRGYDENFAAGSQRKGTARAQLNCLPYDVVHILRKSRAEVTDCVVQIEADRAAEDPKVFTRIHFHFVVTGKALKPQQVERAVHLSAEKYCSASIMLARTAAITHDFEILEAP